MLFLGAVLVGGFYSLFKPWRSGGEWFQVFGFRRHHHHHEIIIDDASSSYFQQHHTIALESRAQWVLVSNGFSLTDRGHKKNIFWLNHWSIAMGRDRWWGYRQKHPHDQMNKIGGWWRRGCFWRLSRFHWAIAKPIRDDRWRQNQHCQRIKLNPDHGDDQLRR